VIETPDRLGIETRADSDQSPSAGRLPITVVIPVRNAEEFLPECLESVARSKPAEIIVVDGRSTDRTMEIAGRFEVLTISDEGRGVAAARMLGARAAGQSLVALVDADVVLPDGALDALLAEFSAGGYDALQAAFHSTSGPGYWGRALASHHNTGRSRNWFGLAATIFKRETLLACPLDSTFVSGEDIDLRWRLTAAGNRIGVSRDTVVRHRFGDSYDFALGQFRADGAGLARMTVRHRGGFWLLFLPAAAAVRGMVVTTLHRRPQFVLYYAAYCGFNYASMIGTLAQMAVANRQRRAR
jgi:glycosyltransferase involved in cell wall biosynthesis